MDRDEFDEMLRRRVREEPFPLPEGYADRVRAVCESLEKKTVSFPKRHPARRWMLTAAAALAVFIAVPNVSSAAACAMKRIPLLGAVVRVVTFRHYTQDTDRTHADVSVPMLEEAGSAGDIVNEDVQTYTEQLLSQFQTDCAAAGEAYEGLNVTYRVVADSENWFTLRVDGLEVKASGYEFSRIYNIDKTTDRVVKLSGLFREDSGWNGALSDEILRQMKSQEEAASGAMYFTDEFSGVEDNQNYYFSADGNLVLVFDEYTVAPGSMGQPEFIIDSGVYGDFLK